MKSNMSNDRPEFQLFELELAVLETPFLSIQIFFVLMSIWRLTEQTGEPHTYTTRICTSAAGADISTTKVMHQP